MHLYIKNMVCPRCILAVEQILQNQDLQYSSVKLGRVALYRDLSEDELHAFNKALQDIGFEVLDDQRKQLIEKVKTLLIAKVQKGEIEDHFSIARYLTQQLHKDYSLISKLFTLVEGITLEQFFILQKVEKVKEWLVYGEQSLGEIAVQLGYSSVQHLSGQFRKITGMTPGEFRKVGISGRRSIDDVSI